MDRPVDKFQTLNNVEQSIADTREYLFIAKTLAETAFDRNHTTEYRAICDLLAVVSEHLCDASNLTSYIRMQMLHMEWVEQDDPEE